MEHFETLDDLAVSFCSVRTAEWCLPLVHLNDALALVIQLAQDYASKQRQYSLLPIYVRLVKTDDLFMSPASKFRPDGSTSEENCYIEVREIISFVHSGSNSRGELPNKKNGGAHHTFQGLKKRFSYLLKLFTLASKGPRRRPSRYLLGYRTEKMMTGDNVLF